VLSLDQIRPDEHFLDLGGNSVMASRIASRLSLAFRTEITVRDLFENATIAALSGLLTERVRPASATAAC
jgi:aryl carrier-like protein